MSLKFAFDFGGFVAHRSERLVYETAPSNKSSGKQKRTNWLRRYVSFVTDGRICLVICFKTPRCKTDGHA